MPDTLKTILICLATVAAAEVVQAQVFDWRAVLAGDGKRLIG